MSNELPKVSAHALQRFSERLDIKKQTIDTYRLMTSRNMVFDAEKSDETRAMYNHINDNGFITKYIFNGDSSVLLTVIPKGNKENNVWITEREIKKLVPFDKNEITDAINWILPNATKAEKLQVIDLFLAQKTAMASAYTKRKDNNR